MFERRSGPIDLPDYLKFQIESDAEQYAYDIRRQINISLDQPIDILDVIERFFHTYVLQLVDLETSGFVRVFGNHKFIFLNASESLGRQYYTAAHELCHILRDLSQIKEIEELEETERVFRFKKMEYYAYKFADYFLTPRPAFAKCLADLGVHEFTRIEPQHIFYMQQSLRISYRQAVRMLHKMRIINEQQRTDLSSLSSKENPNQLLELSQETGYSNELSLSLPESRIPMEFYESITHNVKNARLSPRKLAYLLDILHIRIGSEDGPTE
ncbi:hypothetical protein D3C73_437430 [compost metagenome]